VITWRREERSSRGERRKRKEKPSRIREEEEKLEIFDQDMRGELIHLETTNGQESKAILLSIPSSLSLIWIGFYVGFGNLIYMNLYVQSYIDI
jgi:hypothetical protein